MLNVVFYSTQIRAVLVKMIGSLHLKTNAALIAGDPFFFLYVAPVHHLLSPETIKVSCGGTSLNETQQQTWPYKFG